MKALRHLVWRYPEWWCLGLSGGTWLVLVLPAGRHDSHRDSLVMWMLMVAAMMLPLAASPARMVAGRSLWRRRHRAIAGFLVGFLAPWSLAGLIAVTASVSVDWRQSPQVAASALGMAMVWEVTSIKRRSLVACRWSPVLAPAGWQADRDCVRYGWRFGIQCLVSCWAVMAFTLVVEPGLLVMAALTVLAVRARSR